MDFEKGVPFTRTTFAPDGKTPVKLPVLIDRAPCLIENNKWKCPKGNFHTAKEKVLTPENQRTLLLFKMFQTTNQLPEDFDQVMAEEFTMLKDLFDAQKIEYQADLTARLLGVNLISALQMLGAIR